MGTARTSPKVVRARRANGVRSNRGKVRRHFPKAHRNDRHLEGTARAGKTWTPPDLDEVASQLLARVFVPRVLVDDVRQEIIARLLEGSSAGDIQGHLPKIVTNAKRMEWGEWGVQRLDAPFGDAGTLSQFIDTQGRLVGLPGFGRRRHFSANKCVQCGRSPATPHAAWCWACWSRDGQKGRKRSDKTRLQMGATRRRLWAGSYGEQRRMALRCTEKVCRHCGFTGPWDQFTKNPKCFGGVDKICKACNRSKKNEWKQRQRQAQAGTYPKEAGLSVLVRAV